MIQTSDMGQLHHPFMRASGRPHPSGEPASAGHGPGSRARSVSTVHNGTLTLIIHHWGMTWDNRTFARRRPDKQVLFVVCYGDGSRSFMRVPPQLAMFGASPSVLGLARERQ